jgi:Cdc6-like AAA superfamily ATPase
VLIGVERYTEEEIKQILKERAEHTFKSGTISDRILDKIAKAVSQEGDIRFGFRILLTAGMLAEKAKKQTIDAANVSSAIDKERRVQELRKIDYIEDQLRKLEKKFERDHGHLP